MVRFLRINPLISGLHPILAKSYLSKESCWFSVVPGVGITRSGHIERKDLDTGQ